MKKINNGWFAALGCTAVLMFFGLFALSIWGMWHEYYLLSESSQHLAKFIFFALFFFNFTFNRTAFKKNE